MTQEKFLSIADVMQITNLPRSTVYYLMKNARFPQNIRLSHKRAVWIESEVLQWQSERQSYEKPLIY